MAVNGSQHNQLASIKKKPVMSIEMDPSKELNDVKLNTPSLDKFKGIANKESTAIFNSDAKLKNPKKFGRTIKARVTKVFSKSAHQKLKAKHAYQTELANRRVAILTGTDNDPGTVVDNLLQMVKDCSSEKNLRKKSFVKAKSLTRQVKKDIRIHLSNEIKQATTPDRLNHLYALIDRLGSASEAKEKASPTLDKKAVTALKKQIDTQCNRIARQLKDHLKKADMRDKSPYAAVCMKCQCLLKWSETIERISPVTSKVHQKQLVREMADIWVAGVSKVQPAENDLGETKNILSTIKALSEKVKTKIKNTLGEKSGDFKKAHKVTDLCLNSLMNELTKVPELVTDFLRVTQKIERLENNQQNHVSELKDIKRNEQKKATNRANLKKKKEKGFLGRFKLIRRVDIKYQKKVGVFKKETKNLSRKTGQALMALHRLQLELQEASGNRDTLNNEINQMIEKYGKSILELDQFKHLKTTDETDLTVEMLMSAIKSTATPKSTATSVVTRAAANKPKSPAPPLPAKLIDRSISAATATNQMTTTVAEPVDALQKSVPESAGQRASTIAISQDQAAGQTTDGNTPSFIKALNTHTVENKLKAFRDNVTHRDIKEQELDWVVDRTNYCLKNKSVDLHALSNFITYFEGKLNKEFEENGHTAYYDRGELLDGFAEGMKHLENAQSYDKAQTALDNASKIRLVPDDSKAQTDQSQVIPSLTDVSLIPVNETQPQEKATPLGNLHEELMNHFNSSKKSVISEESNTNEPKWTDVGKKLQRSIGIFPNPGLEKGTNPINEAIYQELTDRFNQDENDDQIIFSPNTQKEEAIKLVAKFMAKRIECSHLTDEKIWDIATQICNLKNITKEGISDLIDPSKSN